MDDPGRHLRFDGVDVFAERAFTGNPLAVVHGAEGLGDAALIALAREFNLSETVFPLPPTRATAGYRARIFTPAAELPFARLPEVAALRAAADQQGQVLVVALDLAAGPTGGRVHARMFGPGVGVAEDPATGSAAVALAVFLVDRGLLAPDGESAFTVDQGAEMGRPSRFPPAASPCLHTDLVSGRRLLAAAYLVALPHTSRRMRQGSWVCGRGR